MTPSARGRARKASGEEGRRRRYGGEYRRGGPTKHHDSAAGRSQAVVLQYALRDTGSSGSEARVVEYVEARLSGADEIEIAVAVHVAGLELEPGPDAALREVLERLARAGVLGGVLRGLPLADHGLSPGAR